jgi:hypothetical protein
MLKRKYRAGVAAVLVGAVLFSPLLCGMTCMEGLGVRHGVSVDVAAPVEAQELVGKIVESGVGCMVIEAFLDVDAKDLASVLEAGNWIWFGIEPVESIRGEIGRALEWM